jgi:predicted ATPase
MTVQPIASLLQDLRLQRHQMLAQSQLPPLADLIGRDAELATIMRHLAAPDHRLISLIGPGGVGKTSLALQVAASVAGDADVDLADGVAVALLAPATTVDDVPRLIAAALGITLQGARPSADQIVDVLAECALLLILDNVEQLLGGADGPGLIVLLQRMLHEARGLRLLVTSRERLRLRDEWVVELSGLAVPAAERRTGIDGVAAMRLFVARAERAAPDFRLDLAGRAAVARICRQVEGLPLAIELAASWVDTLAVADIAAEVDRALDFLVLPTRDAPERHRSMRAVLDQSWARLNDAERAALMRLAVFRGGADRDATTAITGAALPTLQSLLNKSLLRREIADGVTRYTLHELVRQYAAERLAADPQAYAATEAQHIAYYAALLGRTMDPLTSGSTPEGHALLVRNSDNLRAAWERAADRKDIAALGAMQRSFWVMIDSFGWLPEAVTLLGRGADALRGVAGAEMVRGQLLTQQGYFLVRVAEYDAASAVLEEGVALLEGAGAGAVLAMPLVQLGSSYYHQARFDVGQTTFERA